MQSILKKYWFLFLKTLLCIFVVVLLLSSCSDGGSSSGAQGESVPSGDYSYLYAYNAYRLDGHTIRWASETIPVYGATGAGWQ